MKIIKMDKIFDILVVGERDLPAQLLLKLPLNKGFLHAYWKKKN
ncbi:MAG: hypothetical protein ACTSU4_08590 [Promethearchaeota archaeon]